MFVSIYVYFFELDNYPLIYIAINIQMKQFYLNSKIEKLDTTFMGEKAKRRETL